MTSLAEVAGKRIVTIEGLAQRPNRIFSAWIAEQASQCGYCQPGQIMQAVALLQADPHPSDGKILETMKGNLCRCGTYPYIQQAIKRAAKEVKKP
jgi:aerobic-type carbon monoxide dehydrogenase small subunit (CoxS/CutS family)